MKVGRLRQWLWGKPLPSNRLRILLRRFPEQTVPEHYQVTRLDVLASLKLDPLMPSMSTRSSGHVAQ